MSDKKETTPAIAGKVVTAALYALIAAVMVAVAVLPSSAAFAVWAAAVAATAIVFNR